MTDKDKIEKLRVGIMCAVIQLFHSDPDCVVETFTLEELDEIQKETEHLCQEELSGIYKDVLDMTKADDEVG